jgi:hypothetical protein
MISYSPQIICKGQQHERVRLMPGLPQIIKYAAYAVRRGAVWMNHFTQDG